MMVDFKDDLQRNRNICNNCFRRTHVTLRRTHAVRTDRDEVWYDELDDAPEDRQSMPASMRVAKYSEESAQGGIRRVCECGVLRHTTTQRPLSQRALWARAVNLSHRLEELNEPDVERYWRTFAELHNEPEMQGKQDEIFKQCVKAATS